MVKNSKKIISIGIIVIYMFSLFSIAFAQPSDISKNSAAAIINEWIAEGLADNPGNGLFKPDDAIQRIEFFKYINRVFNFTEKSTYAFTDVISGTWYSDDIAKAVAAGYLKPDKNKKVYPFGVIKRADAAEILAKVFELKSINTTNLNQFDDEEKIPASSRDSVSALVEKGYIALRPDNKFGPFDSLTRAETIKMIDAVMGELTNKAGTYSSNSSGNQVVNAGGITLKNMAVNGDLYLTEGIGEGNVTLENVTVKGKTIVHGGGENSIIVKNSSLQGDLLVLKKNGKVRIIAEGTTTIPNTILNSGARLEDTIIGAGGFSKVQVAEVQAQNQVEKLKGKFTDVNLVAADAAIQVEGSVDNVNLKETANNANVSLISGSITQMNVLSDRSYIDLKGGTVANFNINSGASDASVQIGSGATITTLNANSNVDVNGQGAIMTANIKATGVSLERRPILAVNVDTGVTADVGGSDVTTAPASATQTAAGTFSITPASVIAGAEQIFTLTYTLGDNLNNGSVIFSLPQGLLTETGNTINIAGLGATDLGQYYSNDYRAVTIPSLNISAGKTIVLKLLFRASNVAGISNFSVKADADGSGPRLASIGSGNETKSFAINGRTLTWDSVAFIEGAASDGTIANTITGTLTNETFANIDFNTVKPYTVSNVPAGLTVNIQRTSSTTITMSLTGTANLHSNYDSITNMGITFKPEAFVGNDVSLVAGASTNNMSVSYTGPGIPEHITAVTSSTPDGSYKAGQLIPITVTFSGLVQVTGTPVLALNSGTAATYISGSGTNTLTFEYVVVAGDNTTDLDYSATTALSLSGGTIESPGNALAADLALPSPGAAGSFGAAKAIVIDTMDPLITGVVRVSNTQITVTLSELGKHASISKGNAGGFTVFMTGTPAKTYTVTAINAGATDDIVILTVADMGTAGAVGVIVQYTAGLSGTIADIAGNVLATNAGVVITPWDTIAPVATVTVPAGTLTDAAGQYVNVASNKGNGKVYIIQVGVIAPTDSAATAIGKLQGAVTATPPKGVVGNVAAAGVDVRLSTAGLTVGNYDAYAVDAAGNLSAVVTGQITISSNLPPVLTPATATVDVPFAVTFNPDNLAWRNAISSITIDGTTLDPSAYDKTAAGVITFDPSKSSLLQAPGVKVIRILAPPSFTPVSVNQTIQSGAAKTMFFYAQPVTPLTLGVLFTTQPKLKLKDKYGNDSTTDNTTVVTVAKGDAGIWTLRGTTSITAVNGVVAFTDLTATRDGKVLNAKLSFTATGIAAVDSNTFTLDAPTGNEAAAITQIVTTSATINPLPASGNLYINVDVLSISGTATSTNSDLAQIKIRIKNSNSKYLTSTDNTGSFSSTSSVDLLLPAAPTWTLALTGVNFPNGSYTIEAIANDGTDGATNTYTFTVDKTPPSGIYVTEPLNNGIAPKGGYIKLTSANGVLTYASWKNIFDKIIAHTGQSGDWISGVAQGSLSFSMNNNDPNSDSILITNDDQYNVANIISNFDMAGVSIKDLAGNDADPIIIYALQAPPPEYVSSTTSTNGKTIEVKFDKAMAIQWDDAASFIINNGLNVVVNTAALKVNADMSIDDTTIVLTLKTAVTNTQFVTLAYTAGKIKSLDNGVLQSFDPQNVHNIVLGPPSLISAKTNSTGSQIELKFSKDMADPAANATKFVVNNGAGNPVTGASLKGSDKTTIVLDLFYNVLSTQNITVGYTSGTVTDADGYQLATFLPLGVNNYVIGAPDITGATTSIDGKTVELVFSKKMKDPSGEINNFIVTNNGAVNLVKAAFIKPTDLSGRTIVLSLENTIGYLQPVTVQYTAGPNAGQLLADDTGILASFTKPVPNAVKQPPTFVSATTSTNGLQVEVKFSLAMMPDPSLQSSNFKIFYGINSTEVTVSGASLKPADNTNSTIVLTVAPALTKNMTNIKVTYTAGGVVSSIGGILANFAGNVTNVVIGPPEPKTLKTAVNGKTVEITFDKTLAAPTTFDLSSFTVNNGPLNSLVLNAVTNVALKPLDSSTLVLTLTAPVEFGDLVNVSYGAGNLTGWDGTIVASFGQTTVINTVIDPPTFLSATTTVDGGKIELTFSKAMAPLAANAAGFSVSTGNISSAALGTDSKKIVLTLTNPITYDLQNIKVVYSTVNGTVLAFDNGILGDFTGDVTNLVIAPPTDVSLATTDDGTMIEYKFDKAIADPIGNASKFTINGVANSVKTVALKSSDNTVIVLTLTTAATSAQSLKLAYTPGTVKAADGGILGTFTLKDVTNMVMGQPSFSSAATTADGKYVEVTFSKPMAVISPTDSGTIAACFKIKGVTGSVTATALKPLFPETIVLTLKTPVTPTTIGITVSYTAGTLKLKATDDGILATFTAQPVANAFIAPPTYVSSTTSVDGSTLEVKFNKSMVVATGDEVGFTVSCDGSPVTVNSAALKSSDDTTIVLTLASKLIQGKVVTVTYTDTIGKILAKDKGILGTFNNKQVTNIASTPATINYVSATNLDGTYSVGQNIYITVKFSRTVTVTGLPRLKLEVGTTNSNTYATYLSGSSSDTLTFLYVVQAGDASAKLNYDSTITTLDLNGGKITNTGNTIDIDIKLPIITAPESLGNKKAIVIDTKAPIAPTIAVPIAAKTSGTLSVTSNKEGKAYYVILPVGEIAPGAIQIKLGTDAQDVPLPVNLKGKIDLVAGSAGVINGLSLFTGIDTTIVNTYDIYVVVEDLVGNLNTTVKTIQYVSNTDAYGPPTLTCNTESMTDTTISIPMKLDKTGKVYYIVLPANAPTPSVDNVLNGMNVSYTALAANRKGSISLTANTIGTINITGLTPLTSYDIYIVAQDCAVPPNIQAAATKVPVKTVQLPNKVAPVNSIVPSLTGQTDTTANIAVRIDEDGKFYYVVLASGSTAPSSAQVKAGTNASGTAPVVKGALALSGNIDTTIGITGLKKGTAYDIYLVAEDTLLNLQSQPVKVSVTTDTIIDIIAPNYVSTYPSVEAKDTSINLKVKIDESGKAFYVVLNRGKPIPSSAQVKAAKDGANAVAVKSGSVSLIANTETVIPISGLTVSTPYDVYIVSQDVNTTPNVQLAPVALMVTTSPLDLTGVGVDIAAGKLTGTTVAMQYSFDKTNWIACTDSITLNVAYTAGEIYVREKLNGDNYRLVADAPSNTAPTQSEIDLIKLDVAAGTITGTTINMEYCIAGGAWLATAAGGTTSNVTFQAGMVQIRNKATISKFASAAKDIGSTQNTPGQLIAAPIVTTLVFDDLLNTITGLTSSYEYKIGTGSWIAGGGAVDLSGSKVVQVRLKATSTALAGVIQTITFTANLDLTVVGINMALGQITKTTTAMEYSLDSTDGTDGNWTTCLATTTPVTLDNALNVYVRAKAQIINNVKLASSVSAPTGVGFTGTTSIKLTGTTNLMEYSLDGGTTWQPVIDTIASGAVSINVSTTPNFDLRLRVASTSTTLPSKPTACLNLLLDLSGVGINVANNSITTTTVTMEYSLNSTDGSNGTWNLCSDPATAGLPFTAGFVYVRSAAQPKNFVRFTIPTQTAAPAIIILPTAVNSKDTKMTLLITANKYQYVVDSNPVLAANSTAWSSAFECTGTTTQDVTANGTQYIHIRIKGSATKMASVIQNIDVNIDNIKPDTAPSVVVDSTTITASFIKWTAGGATDTLEFSLDGSAWANVTGATFNYTGTTTAHVLYVRVKATANNPASNLAEF